MRLTSVQGTPAPASHALLSYLRDHACLQDRPRDAWKRAKLHLICGGPHGFTLSTRTHTAPPYLRPPRTFACTMCSRQASTRSLHVKLQEVSRRTSQHASQHIPALASKRQHTPARQCGAQRKRSPQCYSNASTRHRRRSPISPIANRFPAPDPPSSDTPSALPPWQARRNIPGVRHHDERGTLSEDGQGRRVVHHGVLTAYQLVPP